MARGVWEAESRALSLRTAYRGILTPPCSYFDEDPSITAYLDVWDNYINATLRGVRFDPAPGLRYFHLTTLVEMMETLSVRTASIVVGSVEYDAPFDMKCANAELWIWRLTSDAATEEDREAFRDLVHALSMRLSRLFVACDAWYINEWSKPVVLFRRIHVEKSTGHGARSTVLKMYNPAHSFVSTTIDFWVTQSEDFVNNNTVMVIVAEPGTPMVFLPSMTDAFRAAREQEMLIYPLQSWQFDTAWNIGSNHYVLCRVRPHFKPRDKLGIRERPMLWNTRVKRALGVLTDGPRERATIAVESSEPDEARVMSTLDELTSYLGDVASFAKFMHNYLRNSSDSDGLGD